MKNYFTYLFMISFICSYSQSELSPGTKLNEAFRSVKDGYTTKLGWQIKEGDTLKLGTGSRDRQFFSYIYSSPNSLGQIMIASAGDPVVLDYLGNDYNNMVAVVKKFGAKGNKKTGYLAYAVIGIGELENYWVEIENAISYNEIIPSDSKYIPEKEIMEVKVVGQSADKYVQLAKIKKLYDDGVLTKEEYEMEKDKVLKAN